MDTMQGLPTAPKDPAARSRAKKQLQPAPLKTPFRKIAMALSGGGFRASSFSIGAMSYLNRLKYRDAQGNERSLLDNVEFISSASGGSFPGILYSAYTRKGLPFETAYKDILEFMRGETLLEEVLAILGDDKEWEGGEKSRNLINAFARIYDRKLFKGEVFGVYWEGTGRSIEVCFNATEFYRGISFRWQTDGRPFTGHRSDEGKTGNQYIYIDKETNREGFETLKRIKLGDIMASSSCFPAGFEPIVYPRDFSYKGLNSETLQQAMIITDYNDEPRLLDTSIGLMDGGVDDNQGLYSAMLADQRRRKYDDGNGFDLVMVTDVASYFMDPYVPPAPDMTGGLRKKSVAEMAKGVGGALTKMNRILKILAGVSGLVLVGAILLLVFAGNLSLYNFGLLLLSPSILVLLVVVFFFGYQAGNPVFGKVSGLLNSTDTELLALVKEQVPAVKNLSDKAVLSLMKFLQGTKLGFMEQMGKARVNSMLSMTLDINLKQTRRLIFDIFYGNFYGKDTWGNRRVSNIIYELSLLNISSREAAIRDKFNLQQYPLPAPSPDDHWADDCQRLLLDDCMQLNGVAEQARTMGTTLWYDAADAGSQRMKKVVACGQFTTCAKMLEYVLILERVLQQEAGLSMAERTVQFDDAALTVFNQVKLQLEDDWKQFKEDPYFVFNVLV